MVKLKLKQFRLAASLSRERLARKAGCTETAVYYIETGKRHPRFDLAVKLADAVGHPVEEVFPAWATAVQSVRNN